MKFPENKNIVYGQDMNWWVGVPSGVDFTIDEIQSDGKVWLSAPQYGGKPYGNGRIVIYLKTHKHLEIPT